MQFRQLLLSEKKIGQRNTMEWLEPINDTEGPGSALPKLCPRASHVQRSKAHSPAQRTQQYPVWSLLPHLHRVASTYRQSLRSLRGHIRVLFARGRWTGVDIGPALRRADVEHLQPDERTLARSRGIEQLQAIYPWVDTVDLEVFLRGFDVGEQWALHSHRK